MTKKQIVERALRDLGVIGSGDVAQAEEYNFCTDALEAIESELTVAHSLTLGDLDSAPAGLGFALSRVVGADVAFSFDMPPRETRARAIGRVRAFLLSDDRDLAGDLDGDGSVDDAEACVYAESFYY